MAALDEEIKKLTTKIEAKESKIVEAEQCNRSEAYLNGLRNELIGLRNELIELRKKENILLGKSQKSGIYFYTNKYSDQI